MVVGSNVFLEFLYNYFNRTGNEITLLVSDGLSGPAIMLTRKKHDDEGAVYTISGFFAREHEFEGEECWLCNVVHDIFKEHPKKIGIHAIVNNDKTLQTISRFFRNPMVR